MARVTVQMTLIALILGVSMGAAQRASPQEASESPSPSEFSGAVDAVNLTGVWGARFLKSLADDPPMLPEGRAMFEATDPDADPIKQCMPPGVPRINNLAFLIEIVQTPEVVYFLYEYNQHVRRVYLNREHPQDPIPSWFGHSIGHWEGRTLVIDTLGFHTENNWLDGERHLHSDALRVVERFTLSADGQSLTQEVTIVDPKIYSEPWNSVKTTRARRDDLEILEFICDPEASEFPF